MASFGSFRVAKGVRLSASSRGLRAHVGPRGARVHFGGGRTGVSTGAGPFTYYTSGSSARGGSRSYGPTKAQIAQAEKEQEFRRLQSELRAILDIHRVEFAPAIKPGLPKPQSLSLKTFLKAREKEGLDGLSVFKRQARKEARTRARDLAEMDLKQEQERLEGEYQIAVAELDEWWRRLLDNEPEIVIGAIDQAFEDNAAPAAPVNVESDMLSLVVLMPSIAEIPEKKPALTPTGKATVKKMTKQERADMYLTLVSGHLLATIKEALAAAPGISRVKAVAVRRGDQDIYGGQRMEVLLAASYERKDLERVRWNDVLPSDVVQEATKDLLWNLKGRTKELHAVDLDGEPELKTFVDVLSQKM